ncbi:hypothetical protein AB4090_00505, partial [Acidithiobacillus sp. IBUN Pt1247-S3]|uniref:hypothetical protein n=1 Tax=Acidithiobacillus sp. IBUN Pt1247-S3 TaxID=3166642 RepID=UPI0034E511D7
QANERASLAEAQATQANERASLAEAQATQANERASLAEAQATQANERASLAEAQATQANERASLAEAQATQANERASHVGQLYEAVVNSRSWKITKPLRLARRFTQWFVRGSIAWITFAPGSRPRRVARSFLVKAIDKVRSNSALKPRAVRILNHFPKLKQRLRNTTFPQSYLSSTQQATPPNPPHSEAMASLSPRARQIYADLKSALARRQQEKT